MIIFFAVFTIIVLKLSSKIKSSKINVSKIKK